MFAKLSHGCQNCTNSISNADTLSLHSKRSGTRLVELHCNSKPRQVPAFYKGLLIIMLFAQ